MKKSKLNKKLDKIKSIKSSKRGIHMSSLMDSYDAVSFFNGLVFFAPVSLLVRTQAGVSQSMFFLLQALLSAITFLGEIPTGFLTDRIYISAPLCFHRVCSFWHEAFYLSAFFAKIQYCLQ